MSTSTRWTAAPGREADASSHPLREPFLDRPLMAFFASLLPRALADRALRSSASSSPPWTGHGHPSRQYLHFSFGVGWWGLTMCPYFRRGRGSPAPVCPCGP